MKNLSETRESLKPVVEKVLKKLQFDYYRSKPDGSNEQNMNEIVMRAVFGLEWPKIRERVNDGGEKIQHGGWIYWSEEAMSYV